MKSNLSSSPMRLDLTPQEVVCELDKHIVGQKAAKRQVAIALRNRWRRMHVGHDLQNDITPNNVLMIGATGVGKTEIARRLAKLSRAPFIKVEASKFTEVGYMGRDVESMVRDLAAQAVSMVEKERQLQVEQEAEKTVEDRLVSAILTAAQFSAHTASDASALGSDRAAIKEQLRSGVLNNQEVEIDLQKATHPGMGMIAGGAVDEATMMGFQDMLSHVLPKKTQRRKVTIEQARRLLLAEEMSKLIDMEAVKEEALQRAGNLGIIFIDEIDKIAAKADQAHGPDVSRAGVQRDMLPIVEGTSVSTKYGTIQTDHILFIAAGAFHVSKPSDLIPELQGRFPIRVELHSLSKQDYVRILKEPKNALLVQYRALLAAENVHIEFEEEAISQIAAIAYSINGETENIGARRLHTVMSHLLSPYLFEVLDQIVPGTHINITPTIVAERLSELSNGKDLNHFII